MIDDRTASAPAGVDVTNCDREPIHVPGSIQPHGVLIATDAATGTIVSASANAAALLGIGADELIGASLDTILDAADVARVVDRASGRGDDGVDAGDGEALRHGGLDAFPIDAGVAAHRRPWTALVHRHEGLVTLELEPVNPSRPGPSTLLLVSAATARLQASRDVVAASRVVVEEVRRITGFDRVMLYRFAADWSGEVLAESRDDAMPSYLGLHFPATDIPVQARALYASNPVRLISDIHYTPSPLRPDRHPVTGGPIDLRFAALRSVSPIHLEYLRNMDVGASMSASILRDGKLWGLIACHHRTPLLADYERRQACALVAQLFAARLDAQHRLDRARQSGLVESLRVRLLRAMAEGQSVDEALTAIDHRWTDLVDARGFAKTGTERVVRMRAPPPDALQALTAWLAATSTSDYVAIDRLSAVFAPADVYRADASGVLAVPLSRVAGSYLLWFRPEELQTVTWAGQPSKVSKDGGDDRLHPRRSFANWTEEVRGRSMPWSGQDIAAALQLREVVLDLYVREKDELERQNLKLATSARDLETFIYVASHDIKEPLRQMEMLTSLLRTHLRPEAEEEVETYFDEFRVVANRLRVLTDELADYAKLGRVAVGSSPVVLAGVLEEVLAQRHENVDGAHATFDIGALPVVVGERAQLFQVFDNLVGNALKYRHPDRAPHVRITSEPVAAGADGERPMTRVSVADNGIGFESRYDERVFEAFWRLHSRDRFPGSGIGLAICRRIIERHHGRIEAHGVNDVGATFAFTVPLASPPFPEVNESELPCRPNAEPPS